MVCLINIRSLTFVIWSKAGTAQNYYKYIAHYVTEADYEAVKALGIENPEAYDFNKILEW